MSVFNTGLLAYWSFTDGWNDEIVGYVGNPSGTCYVTESGILGSGVWFGQDGAAGDHRTTYNNTTALNFGSGNEFSISFWVRSTVTGYNPVYSRYLFSRMHGTFPNQSGYALRFSKEGLVEFAIYADSAYTGVSRASGSTTFYDDQWHHCVVTYDGLSISNTSLKIYVDGEDQTLYGSDNLAKDFKATADSPLLFGEFGAGTTWYKGHADEIGIWNRILGSGEVVELYNNGSGIPLASGQASSIFDSSVFDSPVIQGVDTK